MMHCRMCGDRRTKHHLAWPKDMRKAKGDKVNMTIPLCRACHDIFHGLKELGLTKREVRAFRYKVGETLTINEIEYLINQYGVIWIKKAYGLTVRAKSAAIHHYPRKQIQMFGDSGIYRMIA